MATTFHSLPLCLPLSPPPLSLPLPSPSFHIIFSGVFSWITINYLLGRFEPEYHHPTLPAPDQGMDGVPLDSHLPKENDNNRTVYKISTVGSLDMGGASLQVAFEIPHDVSC